MTEIILSICLPNYNQGAALERTIKNLMRMPFYPQVEFLLSDNGSTEYKSREVIEFVRKSWKELRVFTGAAYYKKSDEWFTGFGANLNRLVSESHGEYIWFLGSGDLISINALPRILTLLEMKQFDNIALNAGTYTNQHILDLDSKKFYADRNSNELEIYEFKDLFDYSISCNITKKTVFDIKNTDLEFQNSWPHVEHFMNYLCTAERFRAGKIGSKILWLDQPIDGWFNGEQALNILLELGALLNTYAQRYPDQLYKFDSILSTKNFFRTCATFIHLRFSSGGDAICDEKLFKDLLKSVTFIKKHYLFLIFNCDLKVLRIIRVFNKCLLNLGFR